MSLSLYILIFLLPSMLVSIAIGGYIGYSFALRKHGRVISEERQKTLEALQNVLDSAEEFTKEVDTHNTELHSVEQSVVDISTSNTGEYEYLKQSLLSQISVAIDSNRRLEHNLVCTQYRLEQQAQELDRTRREARLDELSGVGNRKAFDESLKFMLSKYKRHGSTFALLLIDVDHFKWINDTHGHQAGDIVVSLLGEMFQDIVRPSDHVARYGGDEFAILLGSVSLEIAMQVAQRIRERVETSNFDAGLQNNFVSVTLSMGLAVAEHDDTHESLVKKADAALYQSKQQGRNRLSVYSNGEARHEGPELEFHAYDAELQEQALSRRHLRAISATVSWSATAALDRPRSAENRCRRCQRRPDSQPQWACLSHAAAPSRAPAPALLRLRPR